MSLDITFIKKSPTVTDVLVFPVFASEKGNGIDIRTDFLDSETAGFINHAAKGEESFKGKHGSTLTIALPKGADANKAILLGLGLQKECTLFNLQDAGGKLYAALKASGAQNPAFMLEEGCGTKSLSCADMAAALASGLKLRAYSFDLYKSKKKAAKDESAEKDFNKLTFVLDDAAKAAKAFALMDAEVEGVYTARNLVNEPPNVLYPDNYANRIRDLLSPLGVRVEILDEKKMLRKGMGAIMAVGQGSARQPRMVIMHWNGAGKSSRNPLLLVGKGVTFDTGGISLKPGAGMEEMKMDMGGSAAVVGTMQALALRKSKANVIGVVGLAENMPSSNAFRPSDIITSYSGKSIEVLNTDAEGRLVLADCLTYGQEIAKKPEAIIDLATLTGAIMVALGHEYCGSFVNSDDLWSKLESSSKQSGEKLWRMPLDEVFKKDMEGTFGDLQNLGKSGRMAGACTAAGFLEHFIDEGTPWAHLDIAGTAWIKSDKPTVPKYATGFGVRLLNALIEKNYE